MADQTNNLLILPLTDDSAAGGQIGVPRTLKESTDVLKLGVPFELTNVTAPLKVSGPIAAATGVNLTLIGDDHVIAKLGDLAGAGQFQVQDSGANVVAHIDSDGNADFAGNLQVDGNATITGNLIVDGTTISIRTEDVLLQDRFLLQNFMYTTPTNVGQTAGVAYIVKPLSAEVNVSASANATRRFTTSDPSGVLEVGDIVAVHGMAQLPNNGLFVVSALGANYVEVDNAPGSDLSGVVNTALSPTDESGASGKMAQVAISVLRADSTGTTFSTGFGSTKAGIAFDEISGADSITLQQAYANTNGNKIQTLASRDIVFDLDNGSAFHVDGGGAVRFGKIASEDNDAISSFYVEASGAVDLKAGATSSFAVSSGDLDLSAAGDVDIDGATVNIDASGAMSLGASAASDFTVSGDLTLQASGAGSDLYLKSADVLDMEAASLDADFTGAASIRAGSASEFYANANLTIESAGAGITDLKSAVEVQVSTALFDVNASGAIEMDAAAASRLATSAGDLDIAAFANLDLDGASVDIDASGAVSIGAGAASDFTVAGNLVLESTGAGITDVKSAVEVQVSTALFDVNASGAAEIDAGASSHFAVTGDLDLSASANLDLDGATVDIDASGAMSLGAGAASDFTAQGNLTVEAAGSGSDLILKAADKIDADAASVEIDASGAISLGAAAASDFTVAGNLTMESTGAGITYVKSAAEVQVDTALLDVNASGAIELDAGASSRFAVSTGDLDISAQANLDLDGASVDIDASGAMSLGAASASDWTVAANLTLETTGAGILDLKSAAEVQVSTLLFDVNASGAAQIDAAAQSWFKATGAELQIATVTSGELDLTAAGLMDINAGADLDMDVTGALYMDATGAFSLDGGAASNMTAQGNLSVQAQGAGSDLILEAADVVDMNAASLDADFSGAFNIDGAAASQVQVTGADLTVKTTTSGALYLASAGAADFQAAGALTIDSSAGKIQIGGDAVSQDIEIGLAGSRQIVLGSSSSYIDAKAPMALWAEGGVKVENASGGALSAGDLLCVVVNPASDPSSAYAPKVKKADADAASIYERRFFAVMQSASVADGASGYAASLAGSVAYCAFGSAPALADVGKPVFLSTTAGSASMTAPSSSGQSVFQIGYLASATASGGKYAVVIQPQYLGQIP